MRCLLKVILNISPFFVSLGALLVVTSLYLRHRLQTKYRDLSIIFLLLIIFLLGVQYKQYERNEVYAADISSVVTFLNSVKIVKIYRRKIFVPIAVH